jgi:formate dehydrogenase subunit gamma
MTTGSDSEQIKRFGRRDRIEHMLVMFIFLVLTLTGFPQKFHEAGFSHRLVQLLGGIEQVRWIHRSAGGLFTGLVVFHLHSLILSVLRGRSSLAMVPSLRDFRDSIQMIRYYLGATKQPPEFGRFDYREKFEYWGLVLGSFIMISTGFTLMYPVLATHVIPGQFIPAAKVAHSNEGLMAFLVVITWHIYNVHFAPGAFPMNKTMFTGTISKHHLKRDHALEYARMFPEEVAKTAEETQTNISPDENPKA